LRKFSWEEDYDEAGPMPVVKRKLSRDENVEKVETIEVVANKNGERRQSFNIRRKPLSVERVQSPDYLDNMLDKSI
jgi:hypothetical protein